MEIYDALAVADVQAACDVLAPVHEEHRRPRRLRLTRGRPRPRPRHRRHARRPPATYWKAVDRPNVMIKIPGTPEGVGAIEEAIYEGINVNVTLLFAVEAYEAVAQAYIRGLERRHAEGKSLDVNSVASFFVSRVDTLVDKQLDAIGGPEAEQLKGTAALANARAAYARFMEIFCGERWETLAAAGAAVQRPLWASTGVKNPAYPDTLYVDQLIAPHTVNTMPLATLNAVADHGTVPGATARDRSERRAGRAGSRRDRHDRRDRAAARSRASSCSRTAMNELLAGHRQGPLAIVTGRPTDDRREPADRDLGGRRDQAASTAP